MAEQQTEAKDFDTIADAYLSKGEETPSEPSSAEQTEDSQNQAEATGAEPEKTEQVKAIEADKSLSVEAKLAKVKEILGDDEKALDAYIKQKGYHNDPAWQKQREIIEKLKQEGKQSLSQEDKTALEEFKKFRNSAEYIQSSMKTQGYTQEAIEKKLQEAGFNVPAKSQDDVQLVIDKLGIEINDMSEKDRINLKANVSDVVKIADILINDRLSKVLPKELEPVKNSINVAEAEKNANKMYSQMRDSIKNDGILDFDKDIEPVLNKFLDDNPDATLQDLNEHFKDMSKKMSIERLKTGKKKEERDEMKSNLRQNIPMSGSRPGNLKKTGDFEKDADAFLENYSL